MLSRPYNILTSFQNQRNYYYMANKHKTIPIDCVQRKPDLIYLHPYGKNAKNFPYHKIKNFLYAFKMLVNG